MTAELLQLLWPAAAMGLSYLASYLIHARTPAADKAAPAAPAPASPSGLGALLPLVLHQAEQFAQAEAQQLLSDLAKRLLPQAAAAKP